MSERYAQILLDLPGMVAGGGVFDYRLPEDCVAQVGHRVVVPLGPRKVVGIVAGISDTTEVPANKVRGVQRVFDDVRPLSLEWLRFIGFAADYYVRGVGETALGALPQFFRTPARARYDASMRSLRTIKSRAVRAVPAPELNQEQKAALERIFEHPGFSVSMLFGVTGSGKTEVYLHAIERVLAKDPANQVLMLVPEINLTPQLEARVRGRFQDETVVTMHSDLTPVQRARSWLAVHEGRARILVGTRLSVFASFHKLALVLVDEEHDPSYKAGEGLRFSARDLAVKRSQDNSVPCVLGSATPSLETWAQVKRGAYALLALRHRAVQSARLPRLELVDVSRARPSVFAPQVKQAVDEALSRGEQVLVFINRRGYAPVISCTACGWVSRCLHCSGFTVFHKTSASLVCHHCGSTYRVPEHCPSCGNAELVAVGVGTQRIEEAIAHYWPEARVLRIDRDNVRTKNAAEAAFESVHAGEVDIVVGTQMIAKGHDFKRVGLVVVLNADAQLVSHDVRAEERLFATLMQVAGRAGRDKLEGRVMVQTRFPGHPIYEDMKANDYERFAERLLQGRREAMAPPFTHQALLLAQSSSLERTLGFLKRAQAIAMALDAPDVFVYDPVPMQLMRLKDAERGQLLIESSSRARRHAFLKAWNEALLTMPDPVSGVAWTIEVDPAQL